MRPFIAYVFVMMMIFCHSPESHLKPGSGSASATDSLINYAGIYGDTSYINGARLIAANDCLTCHRVNEKSTGPSFVAIAAKYEFNNGNIENLTSKVISGGKGLWGLAAMTPHPHIQYSDISQMVKFILSLKKN